jgi:hypothetical protein
VCPHQHVSNQVETKSSRESRELMKRRGQCFVINMATVLDTASIFVMWSGD